MLCLMLGISVQGQTNNNLLGTWTSSKIRSTTIDNGKKSSDEGDISGERTFIFTSATKCYVVTEYTDVKHPFTYKIVGNQIYFTMDPAHAKKLKMDEDEEYGIELEPFDWTFAVDPNNKFLFFSSKSTEGKITNETVITFKRNK